MTEKQEGIIQQMFKECLVDIFSDSNSKVDRRIRRLQQELIEKININLMCIFDSETLNDVSYEYEYDLSEQAQKVKNMLIGDNRK